MNTCQPDSKHTTLKKSNSKFFDVNIYIAIIWGFFVSWGPNIWDRKEGWNGAKWKKVGGYFISGGDNDQDDDFSGFNDEFVERNGEHLKEG